MSEQPKAPKRGLQMADVFDLLGALVQFVIVVGGAAVLAVALLYGVTGWILDLLGLN